MYTLDMGIFIVENWLILKQQKYFSEIANVIKGTDIEFEERSAICGNALEET